MDEPSNDKRADWALIGLMAFARETGMRSKTNHEELDTIIGDFLADLMHLCDRDDINFDNLLGRAEENWKEEWHKQTD